MIMINEELISEIKNENYNSLLLHINNNKNLNKLLEVSEYLNFYISNKYVKNTIELSRFKNTLNEVSMNLKPTIELSLDNDGTLLIKKHENVNFMTIYNNSHILIKEYADAGNITGVKYELCKLWMMKVLLDKQIHDSEDRFFKKKININEINKTKAFIMNDFKTYLRFVLKKEKNFNFNEYFNNSQFGKEVYKIDKRLLSFIKNIIL